ncbi:MAG TPA: hypothetical protein VGQ09_23820 [Chitinophagaceae bacterium]|jgi:hypothetical protein|nr:hypothetical protein [Chitinophagaceae bacterium]
MFIPTWNKYLPVIKILLKRSINAEQTLDMNRTDFQRAAGGKKVKFTFSIALTKGRVNGIETPSPLAKDLITVLQQDDTTHKLLRQYEFELSMNGDFQLHIKNSTPPLEEESEPATDDQSESSSQEVVADANNSPEAIE